MHPLLTKIAANSSTALRFAAEILESHRSPQKRLRVLVAANSHFKYQTVIGLWLSGHRIRRAKLNSEDLSNYDLVLPFTLEDIETLRRHEDSLGASLLPLPSMDAVALCNDKRLLDQELSRQGFAQHIPKSGTDLSPPLIIKKRISAYSKGIHPVFKAGDFGAVESLLKDPDYYCQHYVEGPSEYALHVIMREGRLVAWLNIGYHYDTEYPVKGHSKVRCNQIEDCEHLELFEAMLRKIGFQGLCCINYKLENRTPMLLEINPRFGGSLRKFFFMMVRQLGD